MRRTFGARHICSRCRGRSMQAGKIGPGMRTGTSPAPVAACGRRRRAEVDSCQLAEESLSRRWEGEVVQRASGSSDTY